MNWRRAALILLAGGLLFATSVYGCVTDRAWFWLDAILVGSFLCYVMSLIVERRLPCIPLSPIICIICLMIVGSLQALNPLYRFDPLTRGMYPVSGFDPSWLFTFDRRTTLVALVHWISLALSFVAILDLAQDRDNRWFLLTVIASIGGCMAIFGITLKIHGDLTIPFTNSPSRTFFGTYVYHAHAAAFLNLCWPAAIALAIRSLVGDRPIARALWINVFFLIFAALFVNISKFGHLAAVPGVLLAIALLWRTVPSGGIRVSPVVWVVAGVLILGAGAILILPLAGSSVGRWEELARVGFGSRPIIYQIAFSMIQRYPFWGCGVGSFQLAFPYFTGQMGYGMSGKYSHAHQDYLQTVVEWGLVGAVPWLLLTVGGYLRGWIRHFQQPEELSLGVSLLALTILGVHALIDFPMQIGSLRLYAAIYLALLWRVRPGRRSSQVKQ